MESHYWRHSHAGLCFKVSLDDGRGFRTITEVPRVPPFDTLSPCYVLSYFLWYDT